MSRRQTLVAVDAALRDLAEGDSYERARAGSVLSDAVEDLREELQRVLSDKREDRWWKAFHALLAGSSDREFGLARCVRLVAEVHVFVPESYRGPRQS